MKNKHNELEHINQAIPPEAHTPMYNIHRFFARKPHNVVRTYIEKYSDLGDIVLDPFCGSGVTISESLKTGRKAIGIDIEPMATFITKMTVKPLDMEDFNKTFKKLEEKLKEKINSLYLTECRKCHRKISAINFIWNEQKPIAVGYECLKCKIKVRTPLNKKDLKLIKQIDRMNTLPYPKNKLYYEDGSPFKEKQKYDSIEDLFTKRNLFALALLITEIKKIKNQNTREFMEFVFTSISHLASKMTPVRPTRPFSSFWSQHSYWYAKKFMESNVWNLFDRGVNGRQGLTKGKKESNERISDYREAKTVNDIIDNKKNVLLMTRSCIDALRKFPPDCVDYVFTDPPYGGSIQYAELTYMWGAWLNFSSNFNERVKDEIIINKQQKKYFDEYYNMIYTAFKEIYRVLKKGKYMTLTFHNPDIKIRNAIIRACVLAGFNFEKIIFQEPPRPSAKGLLQPFGSLQGDYFLRFRKPLSEKNSISAEEISKERYEELVVEIAEKIIAERGEPTHFTYIQNVIDPILYSELKKHGLLLEHTPENVEKILKEEIGKRFVLIKTKIGNKPGKTWWLKDPHKLFIDIIPLNKRVEETIINFFKKKYKASFTEILTEVFTQYKNSLTPDKESITTILNRIANKSSGNMFTLKSSVSRLIKEHEEMVYYLAKIGEKAGFKVHIATDEYGKMFKGKQLRELIDIKEIEISSIPKWNLGRIKKIDVVWFEKQKIIYSFDVENSTNITDSLMRGSNILNSDVKRLIIVPKEYETLMNRVFREPAIQEIIEQSNWMIITFKSLRMFFNKNKGKNKIDLQEFDNMMRLPKEKISEQKALKEY